MKHPNYEALQLWLKQENRDANLWDRWTDRFQKTVQGLVPSQIQDAITSGMRGFTQLVLTGSGIKLPKAEKSLPLESMELMAQTSIDNYVRLSMISGAGTSAGGIVTGLLDLPFLMSFKIKLIFEIGTYFGHDLKDPRERYYALLIFREAFSSPTQRQGHLRALIEFESKREGLEKPLEQIDWKAFQQEYRDYIDLAKLLQFVPGIGIVIGAAVNRQLLNHLGQTAINAYRLRYFQINPEERTIRP